MQMISMQDEKLEYATKYDLIDLLKIIASILIFSMHIGALNDWVCAGFILEVIARWGVPFFFMSSSFFLFRKSKNGNIKKTTLVLYLKRIALLYLVWFIYNIPSIVYKKFFFNGINIQTLLDFTKSAILSSTFTGSWYLVSCMFSATVIFCLAKKFNTKTIIGITSIIQILCIASSVYGGGYAGNNLTVLSSMLFPLNIFGGCFYFALGKMVAEQKKKLIKIKSSYLMISLLCSYGLYICEIVMAKQWGVFKTTDYGVFIGVASFSLLLLALKSKTQIPCSNTLRKISTVVYCGQGNVLIAASFCKSILEIDSCLGSYCIGVVMITMLIIVVLLLQKTDIKFVKYLT